MDKNNIYKNNILSDDKRKQLWLSDLCVKYGELTVTPSTSSLSSSCYSGSTDHSGLFSRDFVGQYFELNWVINGRRHRFGSVVYGNLF